MKIKFILFSLLCGFLCSCGSEEETDQELNYEIFSDTNTVFSDSSLLPVSKVYIDSLNHKKFLDKDGYYSANWNILADAKIELTYFPKHNASGYYAEFGTSPMFLREKNITIEGYVIPFLVDTLNNGFRYVISKYPNSACFFCGGGGGPESVMELKLKPNHRMFREDEWLKFKGRLVLNNGNPLMVNYNLYEAEVIE